MNKKELAKLLFQHKDIKSLFESGQFDASTLRKVISEEIMREGEDGSPDLNAEISQLQQDLAFAQANLVKFEKEVDTARTRLKAVRANSGDIEEPKANLGARKRSAKAASVAVRNIEDRLERLNTLAKASIATSTTEDDQYVAMAAKEIAQDLETGIERAKTVEQPQQLDEVPPDVAKAVEDEVDELDNNVPPIIRKAKASEEEPASQSPPESSEEETTQQTLAAKGWGRADVSIRGAIQSKKLTLENIKESLKSVEAFKNLFNITSGEEEKFAQAREKFDTGWIAGEIKRLQEIAAQAGGAAQVADQLANAGNTIMSFYDYMKEKSKDKQQFEIPQGFRFPTGPAPASEEEFKKQFIEPIDPAGASSEEPTSDEGYIALGKQVIQQADDLLKGFENNEVVERFLGWYVGGLSTNTLEESVADMGVDLEYAQKISNYDKTADITKVIKKNPSKWNDIFTKLDELVKTGKIKINKTEKPSEDEDPKLLAQQVIDETPIPDPVADGDQSPLATEEMDAAWATTLDIFFGKSREYSSFMRQFLLKNQASMLYGMIGVLEQIITGGAGNEERSLSPEETQVRQKEVPVVPAVDADKSKNQVNTATNTASTDTSADDEDEVEVQKESLEEQVINEILGGLFGSKDNEDKEIKFSPKSTKLMRQDLEAMVDLLRSLKTDISQYKKYSTSSSVDPRFDGSTLKRAMDAKLKVVQQSIAHLTKVIDLEVQSQADQLKADGAQAGQKSVELQEASGSDRKVRIAEVEKVYNRLRELYLKGLKVSLSKNQPDEAKSGAEAMKDYVMGEETFMSYFPSNIITSSGGVMTLGGAHKSMVDIIAPFIETIRDIVTITKTQKVSESNLQQAIGNLVMISNAIESMFKVPSLIDREFMKKYIEAAKQNPEDQPLTDEEPTSDGEQSQVKPPGDEVNDEIDQSSEISEEEKEGLKKSVEQSKQWLDGLEDENKSAIAEFVKQMISRGAKKLQEQEVLPYKNEITPEIKAKIASFAKKAKVFHKGFDKMIPIAIGDMNEDYLESTVALMEKDADNFVSHLRTIFMLKDKLSLQTVMKFVQDLAGKAGDAATAALEPIKQKFKEISEPIKNKLKSLTTELVAIKNASKYITKVTAKHLWEMLTSFFKKNLKSVKSNKESEFTTALEEPSNNDLSQEQQQDLEKSKSKLIDSYDKVSFPTKKWMDSLPGTLGSGFASFALELIDLVEFLMKKVSAPLRPIALVMFLKFANPEKFESFEEKTVDELGISNAELISGNEKFVNPDATVPTQQKSNDEEASASEKPKTDQEMEDFYNRSPSSPSRLEESLRPIIEKMLNEHYNH